MNKRILVCGAGSIGKRHIANLLKLGADVSVWRAQAKKVESLKKEFDIETYENLDEAINHADGVVIATATDNHIEVALNVLQAGKALFLEKPVSHSSDGVDDLLSLAPKAVIEVGCQFRSHPNLIELAGLVNKKPNDLYTYRLAMGHRLDEWRKDRDYKEVYSADSSRGGGALFDLIHQIDIALWLFGPIHEVSAVLSKRSDLDIKGDDVTNLLLTHKSGLTGHVQLDMASPVYRCEAEIMTKEAIYKWSYLDGILSIISSEVTSIISSVPKNFERNDLFLSHMSYFLERMSDDSLKPLCSIYDGVDALYAALAARDSYKTGKRILV